MKQVKSLVLAVFLVFALSAGAHGGDIGSPGIRTTTSGDIGSPGAKCETPVDATTAPAATDSSDTSAYDDRLFLEMMLVLLALF